MARPCVYRHDVRCPDPNAAPIGCPKPALSKAAKSVYRCGDCQRCCTPDAAYHRPSAAAGNGRWRCISKAVRCGRWGGPGFRGERPGGKPVGG